jgi:hypothetical protein
MLACLESFPARDDDFHIDFISETLVLQLHIRQSVDSDELLRIVQFKTSQFILKLVHDRHSCAYKRLCIPASRKCYCFQTLTGANIGCRCFDTVGFLGRDIETFKTFAVHTLLWTLANGFQVIKCPTATTTKRNF